jgi:OHCU decarboxylase
METVNALDRDAFVARFGALFEDSPWVAADAFDARPFSSREHLHEALVSAMRAAPRERRLELVRAHPDLAGRAAIVGTLTGDSAREQASAGLDRLSRAELEAFTRTNDAYRERFGFPFVVCVREHTKETILATAAERLRHEPERELDVALAEIAKIARLRLEDAL